MTKLNLLTGTLLAEVVNSPINGEISVIKSVAFGTYISVGNLTQSGGVVYGIWNKTLKKVKNKTSLVKRALVLGLGGGSVAKIINKNWPDAKITGVDLDPNMVSVGKKYLGLDKIKTDIVIEDAMKFITKAAKKKSKYDLICIDLYIGDNFPEKFEKIEFVKNVRKVLTEKGAAVFNRLYYDEKRKQAMKFMATLEAEFAGVTPIFPEANVMFYCRK